MAQYYKYYFAHLILIFTISLKPLRANQVEILEKFSDSIPSDIWLFNENGERVNLLEEIKIPTVISFVYYNCPGICTPLLSEIQSTIEHTELLPGTDYQIITISINPKETSELALAKKKNYLSSMQRRKEAILGWKFYTGDSLNILKASESVGFRYKKVGDEFIHKACIILLNHEAKIVWYNMGINIIPKKLEIAIRDGIKGKIVPTTYKKEEYCFPYEAPAYARLNKITKSAGIVMIFSALIFLLFLIIKHNLNKK